MNLRYLARARLQRVDARLGFTDADYVILNEWLRGDLRQACDLVTRCAWERPFCHDLDRQDLDHDERPWESLCCMSSPAGKPVCCTCCSRI